MKIPRIIHQTWKTASIPEKFRWDFESWREFHPEWQFMFWDDSDLETFVRKEHPDLLSLYLSYPQQINRVMLARYLILRKFGGVFVDIDLECLKSVEPLLINWPLFLSNEPPSHHDHPIAVRRKIQQLVGTSFLASIPNHPFWDCLIGRLSEFSGMYDPLEATGSIFLSSVLANAPWEKKADIGIAWYGSLNGFDRALTYGGETFDLDTWEVWTREAYAVHRWAGTWARAEAESKPDFIRVSGQLLTTHSKIGPPNPRPDGVQAPKISCIMPTRNRFHFAKMAIECFRRQTYTNTELVIVEHTPMDDRLSEHVQQLGDTRIRLFSEPDGEKTLGEVRNFALDQCTGYYIAAWDDDDLCDPFRLEAQHTLLCMLDAHACVMSRTVDWAPAIEHLLINEQRSWEGTLLCEASVMARYGHITIGEDGIMQRALESVARVAWIDMPRLYVYLMHGTNLWASEHYDDHWSVALRRYEGTTYRRVLRELSRRLPIGRYDTLSPAINLTRPSLAHEMVSAILSNPITPRT